MPRALKRPSKSDAIVLAEKLDLTAATALAEALCAGRGGAVTLDASAVTQLGTQAAQVLASAARTWAADGARLRIVAPSPAFTETTRWLGLDALLAAGDAE